MQPSKEIGSKSFKLYSLFYSFAIIVILLAIISLINITVRGLFASEQGNAKTKIKNEIYDPDRIINWTAVCPILKNASILGHSLKWRLSTCYNKTLLYWHIPWIRAWVWKKFDNTVEERKTLKRLEEEKREAELKKLKNFDDKGNGVGENTNVREKETVVKDTNESTTSDEPKKEITTSRGAFEMLGILIVFSTITASIDFLFAKFGKGAREEQASKDQRRCSLADFTMNKHLRKESHETLQRQAAFDEPRKVKRFLHQGSLDRAITRLSPKVSSRLPRQSSVPLVMSSGGASELPSNFSALRRPSIDTSEEERSPNMKRRSRHFIRRH